MNNAVLQWEDVSFNVSSGFWMKKKEIIHGINLSVPKGGVLGLIGPNGAGKTTIIKLGAGLLYPSFGKVKINDKNAMELEARKAIGLLTETQYIYPYLRLREWLTMLARFSGLSGELLNKKITDVLDLVGLHNRASQMMRTLSKGQLQRAGIAQALVHTPEILILDEPMSGLDPYWRYHIQQILLDFKCAGGTILFSSHILADVEKLCDYVALIKEGEIQWFGTLSQVPQKIKAFEAVCIIENDEIREIEKKINIIKRVRQPGGEWLFSFPAHQKDNLLDLSCDGTVQLVSLRPLRQEVEEVFLTFQSEGSLKATTQ